MFYVAFLLCGRIIIMQHNTNATPLLSVVDSDYCKIKKETSYDSWEELRIHIVAIKTCIDALLKTRSIAQ